MFNLKESQKAFDEAKKYMPGGVNSPVRSYPHMNCPPPFIASAKGAHIIDIDGNEYVDYIGSWGPMILGHAHPKVIGAIQKAAEKSTSYGAPTCIETELAKLVTEFYPTIEKIRLVSSGTEATMSALRAARGYTGRDKILKFNGCYHGHGDSLLVKAGSGAATFGSPDSAGVTKGTAQDTVVVPYNDIETFKQTMNDIGDTIAAVIVEPVAGNMGCVLPKDGFLETLREETKKHGTVLIFDEVMCGFRTSRYGAQGKYHIKPDLTCLGKIIGGGLPAAAYGGRREIMNCIAPEGSVYQAGTLSGNPLAVTAGLMTLKEIQSIPDFYEKLEEKTKKLLTGWKNAADKAGVPVQIHQSGSMFGIFFNENPVENYDDSAASSWEQFKTWFLSMLEQGIYLAPSPFETLFMAYAHSEEDIERTIQAAEKAMKKVAEIK
ncbi:glutamate-1-semialdehyde-2,1-aminomutase [Veillonellaceae bacterium DNF00626]|nr:glutamate-1-semialdehyde-2,1-aminomutase [Veillonellaceae bacterium DNF00626]